MHYELYVDSLFLINFTMNLYLLMLVDYSTLSSAVPWRLPRCRSLRRRLRRLCAGCRRDIHTLHGCGREMGGRLSVRSSGTISGLNCRTCRHILQTCRNDSDRTAVGLRRIIHCTDRDNPPVYLNTLLQAQQPHLHRLNHR